MALVWDPERIPLPSTKRTAPIQQIDDLIYGIIRQRRESGRDPGDLLARLLAARDEESGEGMSDQQLRDECVTLFLAGHETTALVMTYTFYLLSQAPEADERLSVELATVLGGRAPQPRMSPACATPSGASARRCVSIRPPGASREALADCEIGGYHVAKGTQLFMIQWLVHRDGRWFDAPEAFRPERWDNDLVKRLPRCAYFPFGDGPRICIGNHFALMEAMLILATIAQQYRLEREPGQALELVPSVTLRPRRSPLMRPRVACDWGEFCRGSRRRARAASSQSRRQFLTLGGCGMTGECESSF